MDRKEQLLNALRNELNEESALVFERNIKKRPIVSANIDYTRSNRLYDSN